MSSVTMLKHISFHKKGLVIIYKICLKDQNLQLQVSLADDYYRTGLVIYTEEDTGGWRVSPHHPLSAWPPSGPSVITYICTKLTRSKAEIC